MKITELTKKEFTGWKKREIVLLATAAIIILTNAILLKDNPFAIISAFCGIMYTILAGKGKVSCYLFGLLGSGCYSYLSFKNAVFGNLFLYLCYYIPAQIYGFFSWNRHLKASSREIIKTKQTPEQRIITLIITLTGSLFTIAILYLTKASHPIVDGLTTFLSIVGMYLTVKRFIEQWAIWMVVNGLSFLMWLNIILSGQKVYSTLVMWGTYLILSFYFYHEWKKEIYK